MNLKIVYLSFAGLLLFALIFSSSSGGRASAANAGNTGAPCDQSNVCFNCHNNGGYGTTTMGFAVTDQATGNPISSYLPGATYTVTLTVIPGQGTPNGYGCQFTAVLPDNAQAGIFQNPIANTQIGTANTTCGARDYVEHNGTSDSPIFQAEWVAPAAGSGDATFYYVGNCVNRAQGTGGDNGSVSFNLVIPEAPACPSTAYFTDVIPDGTQQAGINITAENASVATGTNVILDAGETIDLLPEFTVESGAEFEATTGGGCANATETEVPEDQ